MISEGEKEEIRSLIKVARNRELNFGICMGEKPVETVFKMHRRNIPAALGREAKSEGTTPKVAKGTLVVEGRIIRLTCEGSVPSGLAKNVKKYLKMLKLNYKVEIADERANVVQEEGDDEDMEAAVPAPPTQDAASAPPDVSPEQARFEERAGPMSKRILELKKSDHPQVKKIVAVWDLAQQRAEGGDYRTALKAVTKLAELI